MQVQPLDEDGVLAIRLGTAVWLVALIVLWLFFRDDLQRSGTQWWLTVCAVGAGLGVLGIWYTTRRRNVYRKARQDG